MTPVINYDDKRSVKMLWDKEREKHYINASGWNGMLNFYDVNLAGVTGIEVNASINVGDGKITVLVNNKPVGEVEIPAAAKPTGFKKRKLKFKKPLKGKGMVSLGLQSGVNILEFKLLSD